jgi:hypothetical protein
VPNKLKQYIVFARPQRIAAALLLLFTLQCLWMIDQRPLSTAEQDHIASGMQVLTFNAVPRIDAHSPLVNLIAAAPLRSETLRNYLLRNAPTPQEIEWQRRQMRWILRAPFLIFGLLLGGSLWYVSRRLYGNEGGYVALALYCFSPALVLRGATIQEAGASAWGIFGVVFTGIALAHNLYAPPKKWLYRTSLLGLAVWICLASQPVALIVLPLTLGFMLYLAPGRRTLAIGIVLSAYIFGMLATFAAYRFNIQAIIRGMDLRPWLTFAAHGSVAAFLHDRNELFNRFNPTIILLLVAALVTFFYWKRTRYFGNIAPLMTAAGLLMLAFLTPLLPVATIWALPFLFVFAGGIAADWLESKHRTWAMAALVIILIENAVTCVMMLKQFA